ncbi:MAG TPA: APC family permease [Polyangiales bacterium]|nr:APC family permease [Polyangiales bacterium]
MPEPAKKPLGLFSLVTLGINATIGVGIFFAPSEVAQSTPGFLGAWVYVLTGLALTPVAFVYGVLGGRFAEDGGPYVWARLAFSARAAFFIGWLTFISSLLSSATVVTGLSTHIVNVVGTGWLSQKGWALLSVAALSLTAASGLTMSSFAWSTLTVLKLTPLLLLSLLALGSTLLGTAPPPAASAVASAPDVGRAVLTVVFALQGFEVVPVLAGNAQVQRNVSWATIGSLIACTAFYGVLHAICVYAVPDLGKAPTPLVAAAQAYGGDFWARLLSAGQIVSALGIALGQYVTTPRYLSALGRADGLGEWVGKTDARQVPQRALWITAIGAATFVLREDLGGLFALSSIAVLAQYAVSVLALALLARRGHHGVERKHMLWALPALIGILLVARGAEPKELLTTAGVTALGALLLLARKR